MSAQDTCTITPISPAGLDPSGGIVADGTNVVIECICSGRPIRWFNPNTTRILKKGNVPDGHPYYSSAWPATLVIPTLTYSTSGIYTCGRYKNYPPSGLVTIKLFLSSGKCTLLLASLSDLIIIGCYDFSHYNCLYEVFYKV